MKSISFSRLIALSIASKTIQVYLVEITPAEAQYIFNHCLVSNRDICNSTVASYARQMLEGKWVFTGACNIVFSKNGHLLDGSHRLRACIESGVTIKTLVVLGIEESAYMSMDMGHCRTFNDIVTIDMINHGVEKTEIKVNNKTLSALVRKEYAVEIRRPSEHGFSGTRNVANSAELLEYYYAHKEIFDWMVKEWTKVEKLPALRNKNKLFKVAELKGLWAYLHMHNAPESLINQFFATLLGRDYSGNDSACKLREYAENHCDERQTVLEAWNLYAYCWNNYIKDVSPRIVKKDFMQPNIVAICSLD